MGVAWLLVHRNPVLGGWRGKWVGGAGGRWSAGVGISRGGGWCGGARYGGVGSGVKRCWGEGDGTELHCDDITVAVL